MRILALKHEKEKYETNLDRWAGERGHTLRVVNLEVGESPPSDVVGFDLLAAYGGDQYVYDEATWPWLREEKKLIRETLAAGKPVVGFCLGAQALAATLGASVFRAERPEFGLRDVHLTEGGRDHPVFAGVEPRFSSFHMHGDHFSLPEGCLCLACNDAAANQAFITRDGLGLGFQFHPEYTKGHALWLIEKYPDYFPPGPYVDDPATMIARLKEQGDGYSLFKTILDNFLDQTAV